MDWLYWKGKRIFVQLKSGGYYSGNVIDVDIKNPLLTFFTMMDKFGKKIIFIDVEIVKIVEEEEK